MWGRKNKDGAADETTVPAADAAVADETALERIGEEPIDAETGASSAELDQALEDASGADEDGDAYESRHGGGVDDAGVLSDAPDESSGGALPGGGAVTDERAADGSEDDTDAQREASTQAASTDAAMEEEVDTDAEGDAETGAAEEQRREHEESFAREHDPADHDVEAGAQFRQRGDWTADEHGGPQVQEPDGTVHDPGTEGAGEARASADASGDGSGESGLDEVRDGGHGWGSAAPLEGGVQPLGHPVKAWHDTMTFVLPDEPGYTADPHEWFVDAEAAQRAGFRHAHGG